MTQGEAARCDLTGRRGELDRIDGALDRLARGTGDVLLVEGDAGIGKTRLLEAALQHARLAGVSFGMAAAFELEEARTFAPLVRALDVGHGTDDTRERVATLLDDIAPGRVSPNTLAAQDAIIDIVEEVTADATFALAIDDLQWADEPTISVLAALARRARHLPMLLIAAFRPTTGLDPLVDLTERIGGEHLLLEPLDEESVGRLVVDVTGAAPGPHLAGMVRGARGNPFFVLELVKALRDEEAIEVREGVAETDAEVPPPTLRQTVLRRLRSLTPSALHMLRVAAVLGGSFDVDELAAMLEVSPVALHDDVLAAIDVGLLEEDGPRLRIRHDIIRDAVYTDLPEAIRSSLHDQAVVVLTARDEPVGRIAGHLARGTGGGAGAVDALLVAARELERPDPRAAMELLDRALDLTRADPEIAAVVTAQRVPVLVALGRLGDAEEEAAAAIRGVLDDEVEARLRLGHARALLAAGNAPAAVRELERVRSSTALAEEERGLLLGDVAWAHLDVFDLEASERDALAAQQWAEIHDHRRVLASALAIRSRLAAFAADFDRAVELGRSAVDAAGDDPAAVARTPHLFLGLALVNADRADEALDALSDGLRRAEEVGIAWAVAAYHNALILRAFHCGAWDDATAEAEAGRSLHLDAGTRAAYLQMESMLGLIWLHRGEYELARDALSRAEADYETPGSDAGGIVWLLWLRAGFAELDGNLAEAVDLLRSAFDLAMELRVHSVKLWYGPDLVRLALAASASEIAETVAAAVEAAAGDTPTESARGAASWCRGLVDDDPDRLLAAADAYRRTPRSFDLAATLEAAGAALARVGRAEEAKATLGEAWETYDALGATHHERRVAATLRDAGVRKGARGRRSRPATGVDSLTPTERTVLGLVGGGLANRDIAQRLFVSRRTVETHVGRLYAKLGVRGRVALARAAHELPSLRDPKGKG